MQFELWDANCAPEKFYHSRFGVFSYSCISIFEVGDELGNEAAKL
jgi:hypothetical protein